MTSDIDERDREFITGERTPEGFYRVRDGIEAAIARGLAYAPYADLLWCRDLDARPRRGRGVRGRRSTPSIPASCSPTTARRRSTGRGGCRARDRELPGRPRARWATASSSSPWPGFHALNAAMFELARGYRERAMSAYVDLQQREFAPRPRATPRPATSARSAPATSTRCSRRSAAGPRRRSRCAARPRRSSSRRRRRPSEVRRAGPPGEGARALDIRRGRP